MKGKIITVLIIAFLIGAWIYLRIIGLLGDWETVIFSFLSIILPLIIPYYLQPRVLLKIENVSFDKKQANHNIIGYYLKATVVNKGKKIGLNIDAHFDVKDDSAKSPPLLYVTTETINGQKNVKFEEKPFDGHFEYAWVLRERTYTRILKELRHGDKVDLIFPHHPFGIAIGKKSISSEYLIRLETSKKYTVKIIVKGEDSEKNTVETSKKVKIKV